MLVRINTEGFRGTLPSGKGPRIAFVGDSIVFSGGCVESNTFVSRIAAASVGKHSSGWQCLNLGVSDTGLQEYDVQIRNHVLAMDPQLIVLCFYLNDSRPPQGFAGETRQIALSQWLRRSVWYRLHIVRKLHLQLRALRARFNPGLNKRFAWSEAYRAKSYLQQPTSWTNIVHTARYDWGAAWTPESWILVEKTLRSISQTCKAKQVPLCLVVFPVGVQLELSETTDRLTYPQEQILALSEALAIPCLDLLPELRKHSVEELLADQCHLTSYGSEVVADILFDWLQTYVP